MAGVVKDYTVVLGANGNVQPYNRWGNLDISEDSAIYGTPISAVIVSLDSMDAVVCKIASNKAIYTYSYNVESVVVRVLYRK